MKADLGSNNLRADFGSSFIEEAFKFTFTFVSNNSELFVTTTVSTNDFSYITNWVFNKKTLEIIAVGVSSILTCLCISEASTLDIPSVINDMLLKETSPFYLSKDTIAQALTPFNGSMDILGKALMPFNGSMDILGKTLPPYFGSSDIMVNVAEVPNVVEDVPEVPYVVEDVPQVADMVANVPEVADMVSDVVNNTPSSGEYLRSFGPLTF